MDKLSEEEIAGKYYDLLYLLLILQIYCDISGMFTIKIYFIDTGWRHAGKHPPVVTGFSRSYLSNIVG